MIKDIKQLLLLKDEDKVALFNTKRTGLIPALIGTVMFFTFYYLVIIIPQYGVNSVEFLVDFTGGGLVPSGFILSYYLSKRLKKSWVLIFPSIGATLAGFIFLIHPEFYLSRPFLFTTPAAVSLLYGVFLCTTKENIILGVLNVSVPIMAFPFFDHLYLQPILEASPIVYMGTVIAIFVSAKFEKEQLIHIQNQIEKENQAELLINAQTIAKMGSWGVNPDFSKFSSSSELLRMFKTDKKGFMFEDFESFVHKDFVFQWQSCIWKCLNEKTHFSFTYRSSLINEDSHDLWIKMIGSPELNDNGEVIGILGTCQDISIEKNMEIELENQKTTQVHSSQLAAVGEMASGIAHEINNPMTIISLEVKMLRKLKEKGPINEESFKKHLNRITETITRVTKIIDGLRNVSRDTTRLCLDQCKVSEIFEDINHIASHKLRSNNIKLNLDTSSDEFQYDVYCDRIQISQVFLNLLNNAYDAIESLEDKWIDVLISKDTNFVFIKISNSGPKIPDKIQKEMFKAFYTSKGVGKGTGLGLSISKTIVEKNNGEFFFDESAESTTFVVKLPRFNS